MKLVKKESLSNVFHEYKILKDDVVYLAKTGGVVVYNNTTKIECKYLDNKFYGLIATDEILVVDDANSKIYIIYLGNKKITELEGYGLSVKEILLINWLILTKEAKYDTIKFDIVSEKEIWNIDIEMGFPKMIYRNYIFSITHNEPAKPFCIDTDNGSLFWQMDLSNSYPTTKILHIIGIWEHQLLVFLDNNQIVSLDINNGQILWDLPDFDVHIPRGGTGLHYHWHLENGKLYILKYQQYFSVDLNTQEVALLWQNEDKIYTINHCTYTEDYIYFTAYGKKIEISILGVFNRKTLQIDWLENMTMPRIDHYSYISFHQAPQVAENKLYVLDSGGTLHIFERES